jgi:hypothetical protein
LQRYTVNICNKRRKSAGVSLDKQIHYCSTTDRVPLFCFSKLYDYSLQAIARIDIHEWFLHSQYRSPDFKVKLFYFSLELYQPVWSVYSHVYANSNISDSKLDIEEYNEKYDAPQIQAIIFATIFFSGHRNLDLAAI